MSAAKKVITNTQRHNTKLPTSWQEYLPSCYIDPSAKVGGIVQRSQDNKDWTKWERLVEKDCLVNLESEIREIPFVIPSTTLPYNTHPQLQFVVDVFAITDPDNTWFSKVPHPKNNSQIWEYASNLIVQEFTKMIILLIQEENATLSKAMNDKEIIRHTRKEYNQKYSIFLYQFACMLWLLQRQLALSDWNVEKYDIELCASMETFQQQHYDIYLNKKNEPTQDGDTPQKHSWYDFLIKCDITHLIEARQKIYQDHTSKNESEEEEEWTQNKSRTHKATPTRRQRGLGNFANRPSSLSKKQ
eukprot:3937865-Rhodomonas_salina.1